jgi:hypothetical protein
MKSFKTLTRFVKHLYFRILYTGNVGDKAYLNDPKRGKHVWKMMQYQQKDYIFIQDTIDINIFRARVEGLYDYVFIDYVW